MASPLGNAVGNYDVPTDSGNTTLTFETLPLTPPGTASYYRCDEASSAATSPSSPFPLSGDVRRSLYTSQDSPLAPLRANLEGETRTFPVANGSIPPKPPERDYRYVSRHQSFHYASDRQQSRIVSPLPSMARQSSFMSRSSSFAPRGAAAQQSLSHLFSMERGETPRSAPGVDNFAREDFLSVKNGEINIQDGESKGKGEGLLTNIMRPGNRPTKRLLGLIVLNFAYSTIELLVGLFTGRIGLVSDSFHLTFGCGVLTFSLYAMMAAERHPDDIYTFGYKRLEVLAAFTNALFLLFLSFSLVVEALHAFVQDESEHKHYLIVSAVANLLVNLLGVWFFRNYARVRVGYRRAQDMNHHSICLHVLSDSIRSAGVIFASWLLTFGVTNAETLCLGLVAVTVFLTTLPLFKAAGGVLLQMAPSGSYASALNKCLRQVRMDKEVIECYNVRFWEIVPGSVVGTLLLQVNEGADQQRLLKHVHSIYNEIGVKELTVQIEVAQ